MKINPIRQNLAKSLTFCFFSKHISRSFAKINHREIFKNVQIAKISPREINFLRFAKINTRENLSSRKFILAKIYTNKVIKLSSIPE